MTKSDLDSFELASLVSYRLVGEFIWFWSIVEQNLDKAMGAALGLTNQQTLIVAVNVPFASKVHITKTAMNAVEMDKKKVKHYERHLRKLWDLNDDRKMIVHYLFGPTDDEGATYFMFIKARGKFEVPEIVWTYEDFQSRFRQMTALTKKLTELTRDIKAASSRQALVEALMKAPSPKPKPGGLGLLDFPPPRLQNKTVAPSLLPILE